MSAEFFIKKTNRLPILQCELEDSNGPIDLSGAEVEFVYKYKPTGAVNLRTGTIVSATSGIVQYPWTSGDVSSAGVYWGEWRITFSDGKQLSVPNDSYITFEIIEDLPD